MGQGSEGLEFRGQQGLQACSASSSLFRVMTLLEKSSSSTKSEVMMLTPPTPGFWASTQDMMVGRFLGEGERGRRKTRERDGEVS